MIGRLEAAVAREMAQRAVELAALATERAQLIAAWRVFDSRLAAARAANEDEQRAMEEGRKALEEARAEVARERKTLKDARTGAGRRHQPGRGIAAADCRGPCPGEAGVGAGGGSREPRVGCGGP